MDIVDDIIDGITDRHRVRTIECMCHELHLYRRLVQFGPRLQHREVMWPYLLVDDMAPDIRVVLDVITRYTDDTLEMMTELMEQRDDRELAERYRVIHPVIDTLTLPDILVERTHLGGIIRDVEGWNRDGVIM